MPAKQRVATWVVFGAFCAAGVQVAQAQDASMRPPPVAPVVVPPAQNPPLQNTLPQDGLPQDGLPQDGAGNAPALVGTPNDDGLGLRLGSFVLTRGIVAGVDYTDNVFSTDTGKKSDRIYSLSASLGLASDWSRHSVSLNLDAAREYYEKNPSEDTVTINAAGQVRIDIRRDTNLDLRAGFSLAQESRGSDDLNANATSPSDVYGYNASATLNHRINRVTLSLRGGFQAFEYEDTPLSNGTVDDNSDRNYYVANTRLRVGYEVSPRLTVFTQVDYAETVYERRVDNNGDIRDQQSYGVSAGVRAAFSDLINGEVSVGYREAAFDDPNFDNVGALVANARLTWLPSRLTTITANLATDLGQTTLAGSSGSVIRTASVNARYAWRDNITLNASGSVSYEKFNELSLNETTYSMSFGVDYNLGRKMILGANYIYEKFDSSAAGADYAINTVGVRLTYAD